MWIDNDAVVVAKGLNIQKNDVSGGGSTAGIWVWHSHFTCENCIFSGNRALGGGECAALKYRGKKLELTNVIFEDNKADGWGGFAGFSNSFFADGYADANA